MVSISSLTKPEKDTIKPGDRHYNKNCSEITFLLYNGPAYVGYMKGSVLN